MSSANSSRRSKTAWNGQSMAALKRVIRRTLRSGLSNSAFERWVLSEAERTVAASPSLSFSDHHSLAAVLARRAGALVRLPGQAIGESTR